MCIEIITTGKISRFNHLLPCLNGCTNSLITHDKNTLMEDLVSCLNLHGFWQFFSFVFSAFNDQFEKLYQTPKHLEVR